MATYETKDELKTAAEKRLKRQLSTKEWLSMVPEYSAPYDDSDLKEILAARKQTHGCSNFIEETQRLGQLISGELEKLHSATEHGEKVLLASGFTVRPLGEFWGWSWLSAHNDERRIITLRQRHVDIPGGETLLSENTTYIYAITPGVLGIWGLFWRTVDHLSRTYDRALADVVAHLFWPDDWPGWSRPGLWPENKNKREECLAFLQSFGAPTVRAVQEAMEQRILRLHRQWEDDGAPVFGYDHTTFALVLADAALPGASWEEKRRKYDELRVQSLWRPGRPINTAQQFRVEVTRAKAAVEERDKRRQERERLLYEVGPRWNMDGTRQHSPSDLIKQP